MNSEQLKDLLGKVTQGDWRAKPSPFEVYNVDHGALSGHLVSGDTMIAEFYDGYDTPDAKLIELAPSLARRVLAAEKMAEALGVLVEQRVELADSGDAGFWDAEKEPDIIEARKALAEWKAAQ